jgi:hypothetical protein
MRIPQSILIGDIRLQACANQDLTTDPLEKARFAEGFSSYVCKSMKLHDLNDLRALST